MCPCRSNKLFDVLKKICGNDKSKLTALFAKDLFNVNNSSIEFYEVSDNICVLFCLLLSYQLQVLDDEDVFVTVEMINGGANISKTMMMWKQDTVELIELLNQSLYRWCWGMGVTNLTFLQIFFIGSACKLKSHCVADLNGHCGERVWYYIKSMLHYSTSTTGSTNNEGMDIELEFPESVSMSLIGNSNNLPPLSALMKAHLYLKMYAQLYDRYVRYVNQGHPLSDTNIFTWSKAVKGANMFLTAPAVITNLQIMKAFDVRLIQYDREERDIVYCAAYKPIIQDELVPLAYSSAMLMKGILGTVPQVRL